MTRPRLHQVIIGAGAGDAITSMALELRGALRLFGDSEIYAHHIQPEMVGAVRPLAELPPQRRTDLVIYHASYGIPEVTNRLLKRDRIALIYHNITPSRYFLEYQPRIAVELEWGRHELDLLRSRVVLAAAVSAFNAADLTAMGYGPVHVVPAGLKPSRLCATAPDGRFAGALRSRFPAGYVLSVAQILPHKRHDHVLQAMHLVRWVHDLQLGLVIVGPVRDDPFRLALDQHARRLRLQDVWFTDAISDRALAAAYRRASMFVSLSAHEGLSVPPLEAMSFGVPVIARAAGATADTVAGAGLLLPESSGPMVAGEAIAEVYTNHSLRLTLRQRGHDRVRDVESFDPIARFLELVAQVA